MPDASAISSCADSMLSVTESSGVISTVSWIPSPFGEKCVRPARSEAVASRVSTTKASGPEENPLPAPSLPDSS